MSNSNVWCRSSATWIRRFPLCKDFEDYLMPISGQIAQKGVMKRKKLVSQPCMKATLCAVYQWYLLLDCMSSLFLSFLNEPWLGHGLMTYWELSCWTNEIFQTCWWTDINLSQDHGCIVSLEGMYIINSPTCYATLIIIFHGHKEWDWINNLFVLTCNRNLWALSHITQIKINSKDCKKDSRGCYSDWSWVVG